MNNNNNRIFKTVFQVRDLVHAYDQNNSYLWGKEGKLIKYSNTLVDIQTPQGLVQFDLHGKMHSENPATA